MFAVVFARHNEIIPARASEVLGLSAADTLEVIGAWPETSITVLLGDQEIYILS